MNQLINFKTIEESEYQLGIDELNIPALVLDDTHYLKKANDYCFQIFNTDGENKGSSVVDLVQTVSIIRKIKNPEIATLLLFRHLYEALSHYNLSPLFDQKAINAFMRETDRQCNIGADVFDMKLLPKFKYVRCLQESNIAVYFQAAPSDKKEIIPSAYNTILRAYMSEDARQIIFNYDEDYYSFDLPELMRNEDLDYEILLSIFIAYVEFMMYKVHATYTDCKFNTLPTRNKPMQGNYKEISTSIRCCKNLRDFCKRILEVYTARLDGDMLENEEDRLELYYKLEEIQTGRRSSANDIFKDVTNFESAYESDKDTETQIGKRRGRPPKDSESLKENSTAKTNLF